MNTIFSKDEIIESAYNYFRNKPFTVKEYPAHLIMQEINALAEIPIDKLKTALTANQISNWYHQYRFKILCNNKPTAFESYHHPKRLLKAIKDIIENNRTIENIIPLNYLVRVHGTQLAGKFRPGFVLYYIKKYCNISQPLKIMDTCLGYGSSLIAGLALNNLEYFIGIDANSESYTGNVNMISALNREDYNHKIILYNDGLEYLHHLNSIHKNQIDFCITSPPYYCNEKYSQDKKQSYLRYPLYADWLKGFLTPMLQLQYDTLKYGCFNIVNISNVVIDNIQYPLTENTISIAEKLGFKLILNENITTNTVNHSREKGILKTFEPVLVFQKTKKTFVPVKRKII